MIAGNTGNGVSVGTNTEPPNSAGIAIQDNSITANTGLGIALGGFTTPLVNDSEGHAGPNALQNYPSLPRPTSRAATSRSTRSFTEAEEPNTSLVVDFYADPGDSSGYGQGAVFIASARSARPTPAACPPNQRLGGRQRPGGRHPHRDGDRRQHPGERHHRRRHLGVLPGLPTRDADPHTHGHPVGRHHPARTEPRQPRPSLQPDGLGREWQRHRRHDLRPERHGHDHERPHRCRSGRHHDGDGQRGRGTFHRPHSRHGRHATPSNSRAARSRPQRPRSRSTPGRPRS